MYVFTWFLVSLALGAKGSVESEPVSGQNACARPSKLITFSTAEFFDHLETSFYVTRDFGRFTINNTWQKLPEDAKSAISATQDTVEDLLKDVVVFYKTSVKEYVDQVMIHVNHAYTSADHAVTPFFRQAREGLRFLTSLATPDVVREYLEDFEAEYPEYKGAIPKTLFMDFLIFCTICALLFAVEFSLVRSTVSTILGPVSSLFFSKANGKAAPASRKASYLKNAEAHNTPTRNLQNQPPKDSGSNRGSGAKRK